VNFDSQWKETSLKLKIIYKFSLQRSSIKILNYKSMANIKFDYGEQIYPLCILNAALGACLHSNLTAQSTDET
jgi:hypothetical protein